jgi:hypothetical protein
MPQREVYQFIASETGDKETAEYASRIKGFLDKYEGDPKYLRDIQSIYGRSVGAFESLSDSKQKEILRGEDTEYGLGRVAAWEIYGEGKDAFSRTVDNLLETLKAAGDFSFAGRRSAGEELRAEAAAGVTGQGGAASWAATVADLRKTVGDLREALAALAAKQDVPLTGVVTLTDPNGNHQQVTLTQDQLARLSSGYTFPARFR